MTQPRPLFSAKQWLILAVAAIGFLFDSYELLMTPLVGVPAIAELRNLPPNNPAVTEWMGALLWLTALCGGIFGLLGGWLIDRFGRKRIMAVSIFVYSLSPFAAAFSTSLGMFVFFRCTTFIGICVQFVAAITWVAELFPDKRQREIALGSTQAFASFGGLLVTGVHAWISAHGKEHLPSLPVSALFDPHASWRWTLITGLIPAILIALMLPFVPESEPWRERRNAGTLKRPSFAELFSPQLRRTTIVTTALSACAFGAAFGALQLTPRSIAPGTPELASQRKELAPLQKAAAGLNQQLLNLQPDFDKAASDIPGLKEIAVERAHIRIAQRPLRQVAALPQATEAVRADAKKRLAELNDNFKQLDERLTEATAQHPEARKIVMDREALLKGLGENREKQAPLSAAVAERGDKAQLSQELGGLVGRIILAGLILLAISRRALLRYFLIPGVIFLPLTYFSLYHAGGVIFDIGIFLSGLCVIAQFSYMGEYLPRVFPLHLRGTGGSFATNVGGRMIGTAAGLVTTKVLAPMFGNLSTFDRVALSAGIVGCTVFVFALILSFFLPEPPVSEGEGAIDVVQDPAATPAAA